MIDRHEAGRCQVNRSTAALLALLGCAGGAGEGNGEAPLPLAVTVTIPSPADHGVEFEVISDVLMDTHARVWVLDRSRGNIQIFDSAGRRVRTVGRPGTGPGEFANPAALFADRDHNVWAVDLATNRFSVFDSAGGYLRSYPRERGAFLMPWPGGFLHDGRLVDVSVASAGDGGAHLRLLIYQPAEDRLVLNDSLDLPPAPPTPMLTATTPAGTLRAPIPFAPQRPWALDPRGGVWIGNAGVPRVTRTALTGVMTSTLMLAITAPTVTQTDRDSAMASLEWFTAQGGAADPAAFPDRKPFFDDLLVPDTGLGLWVRTTGGHWQVFGADQQLQASVVAPLEAFPKPRLHGGYLIGVTEVAGTPAVRLFALPSRLR